MFNNKYVFLLVQDQFPANEEASKKLKAEVFGYIDDSLKSIFSSKSIEYVDYYEKNGKVFTYMTTFDPSSAEGKKKLMPLLYEIFAFAHKLDLSIFKDYKVDENIFVNDSYQIQLYKIKL